MVLGREPRSGSSCQFSEGKNPPATCVTRATQNPHPPISSIRTTDSTTLTRIDPRQPKRLKKKKKKNT